MKKFTSLIALIMLFSFMLAFGLTGCGSSGDQDSSSEPEVSTEQNDTDDGSEAGFIGLEKAKEIAVEAAAEATGKDKASLIPEDLTFSGSELGGGYRLWNEDGNATPVYAVTIDESVYVIDAVSGAVLEILEAPEVMND